MSKNIVSEKWIQEDLRTLDYKIIEQKFFQLHRIFSRKTETMSIAVFVLNVVYIHMYNILTFLKEK